MVVAGPVLGDTRLQEITDNKKTFTDPQCMKLKYDFIHWVKKI